MTTKVTVDAHAGWPVRVQYLDRTYDFQNGYTGGFDMSEAGIVEPGTTQDFYVTDSRQVLVSEMKQPDKV